MPEETAEQIDLFARLDELGPGEVIQSDPEREVLQMLDEMFRSAEYAKRTRMETNSENRDAYMGRQDWSYKIPGQSQEFLPKVSTALEQFAAFVKRGLTQFGDWFSIDVPAESPLTGEDVRALMMVYMNRLPEGRTRTSSFAVRMSDAVKAAGTDSLLILKIMGRRIQKRGYSVTRAGNLRVRNTQPWRLNVVLVRAEDWYPDPTGRGLYNIHRYEMDLSEVIDLSKGSDPIFDPDAVEQVVAAMTLMERPEDEERPEYQRGQDESHTPEFRRTVVIDEYWGDLLNRDGTIGKRNVLMARAHVGSDQFLIRPPEDNPFWHGEDPFVSAPIIRVPHSVWHKALYDDAVQLNLALNELFNLILDGAIAEVWGIKQTRPDLALNPDELADGIPQGAHIQLKPGVSPDAKVVEEIFTGQVPGAAMAVAELLAREFNTASLSNDLQRGSMPSKEVKAIEVVEVSQSNAAVMDSIVADLEAEVMTNALRKIWLTILQSADDLYAQEVIEAIGEEKARKLALMPPAERFAMFAEGLTFKVHGLSATLSRARDFQKLVAMMQVVGAQPLLLQAFWQEYDPSTILVQLFKQMNLNPQQFKNKQRRPPLTPDQMNAMTGGGGRQGNISNAGDAGLSAEINQETNPSET